jgi:hypothetical protein
MSGVVAVTWCPDCNHMVQVVWHENEGCGILNKVRVTGAHFHIYCQACGGEWVERCTKNTSIQATVNSL